MTKIDIISGFLGAGKTTFIKKMLKEAFSGEQVVLIENEFGEIGIDGGFLRKRELNQGDEFRMYLLFVSRRLWKILKRSGRIRIIGSDSDRAIRCWKLLT